MTKHKHVNSKLTGISLVKKLKSMSLVFKIIASVILLALVSSTLTLILLKSDFYKQLVSDEINYDQLIFNKERIIDSHLTKVKIENYSIPTQHKTGIYTALAVYKNTILWVDAHGNFYAISPTKEVKKHIKSLFVNKKPDNGDFLSMNSQD